MSGAIETVSVRETLRSGALGNAAPDCRERRVAVKLDSASAFADTELSKQVVKINRRGIVFRFRVEVGDVVANGLGVAGRHKLIHAQIAGVDTAALVDGTQGILRANAVVGG